MKIALVTDAWFPQVNGVVTTWDHVRRQCTEWGHDFQVFHPALFASIPAPGYPEIRLAIWPGPKLARLLDQFDADAVHIATEGPVGFAGRRWCAKRRRPFTTSYHTQFPHYLYEYFDIPTAPTYAWLRWFHGPARHTLVPTRTIREELIEHRFDGEKIVVWTRGVNHDLWQPVDKSPYADLRRPVFVYCGRVAVEKNIEAFLRCELPGSKVVVGDGPARAKLQSQFPAVRFVGLKRDKALVEHVGAADVFVFPSLTDTFGVVMIEAMATGLPVAAYPVTGPIDVVTDPKVGCLDHDLAKAAVACLDKDPADCIAFARQFTWSRVARIVIDHLATGG